MLSSHVRHIFTFTLVTLITFTALTNESNAANTSTPDDLVLKTKETAEIPTDSGIVLETMDAADYTYIKVKTDEDSVWVAMPATKVEKGVKINYGLGMVFRDFESKALGRTFTKVIFSPGLISDTATSVQVQAPHQASESSLFSEAIKKETQQQNQAQSQTQGSPGSAGATVPLIEDSINPATGENSYTVGEIFINAKKLDGKTVLVRGKVVKINLNIMGKNWIHVQDGTGDPMKNSHDLVVTSAVAPELDQVVLIKGNVAADKDFGYGYKYDALIEEATFSK
jgi:hypothetical protein